MLRVIVAIFCLALSCVIVSCGRSGSVGAVAIIIGRGFAAPRLTIQRNTMFSGDPITIAANSNGETFVIQREPGPFTLLYETSDGHWKKACGFEIKQNRVVTVTVTTVTGEATCQSVVG